MASNLIVIWKNYEGEERNPNVSMICNYTETTENGAVKSLKQFRILDYGVVDSSCTYYKERVDFRSKNIEKFDKSNKLIDGDECAYIHSVGRSLIAIYCIRSYYKDRGMSNFFKVNGEWKNINEIKVGEQIEHYEISLDVYFNKNYDEVICKVVDMDRSSYSIILSIKKFNRDNSETTVFETLKLYSISSPSYWNYIGFTPNQKIKLNHNRTSNFTRDYDIYVVATEKSPLCNFLVIPKFIDNSYNSWVMPLCNENGEILGWKPVDWFVVGERVKAFIGELDWTHV